MNFVPLGECALRSVVSLYQNNADQETVVTCHVLRSIIQVSVSACEDFSLAFCGFIGMHHALCCAFIFL